MNKKNQTRHSEEEIKNALAQIRSGQSLSEVAGKLKITKSLIKYWMDREALRSPSPTASVASTKMIARSKKFMDRCWVSMALAFKRLQLELKKEDFKGVKDLSLTISILYDKMAVAAQSLQSESSSSTPQTWEASEETLMILQRHHERKTIDVPPGNAQETNLGAPDVEQQKKENPPTAAPQVEAPK